MSLNRICVFVGWGEEGGGGGGKKGEGGGKKGKVGVCHVKMRVNPM